MTKHARHGCARSQPGYTDPRNEHVYVMYRIHKLANDGPFLLFDQRGQGLLAGSLDYFTIKSYL